MQPNQIQRQTELKKQAGQRELRTAEERPKEGQPTERPLLNGRRDGHK